jgi:hypothetical protein
VVSRAGVPARAPVLVAVDAPTRQSRSTIGVRLALAAPHAVALVLLGSGAVVVGAVGWARALVSGGLPPWPARYLSGVHRWQTRVLSYVCLLTDAYPPFSFADTAYPVRVTTRPDRLRRSDVALRPLLALPAAVVAATVATGLALAMMAAWPVALVGGRVPTSLHQTAAAVVRYQARLWGYLLLLTSEYPWGLFGDADDEASTVAPWQPHPPSPVFDRYWRLVLSASAKNLMVLFAVVGTTSLAGANVANAAVRVAALRADAAAAVSVQAAYQSLGQVAVAYQARSQSCATASRPLPCLTAAAAGLADAFAAFGHRLDAATVPPGADAARRVLAADGGRIAGYYRVLAAAPSARAYAGALVRSGLAGALLRFDRDYQALGRRIA